MSNFSSIYFICYIVAPLELYELLTTLLDLTVYTPFDFDACLNIIFANTLICIVLHFQMLKTCELEKCDVWCVSKTRNVIKLNIICHFDKSIDIWLWVSLFFVFIFSKRSPEDYSPLFIVQFAMCWKHYFFHFMRKSVRT